LGGVRWRKRWAHSIDDASSDAYTSICRRTTRLQTPLLGFGILTALNWNAKIKDRRDFVMHGSHGSNWGDAKSGTTSACSLCGVRTFQLFSKNDTIFSSVFAYFHQSRLARSLNLMVQEQSEVATVEYVSGEFFSGLGEINPAAFTIPTRAVQGDLGRNALRGFGSTNVDLTLRRKLKLRERLALQARADLFNVSNHPNFGPPIDYLSSPQFEQSTQMLGASLGSGRQYGVQSALSNWRSAIGATGDEASFLIRRRGRFSSRHRSHALRRYSTLDGRSIRTTRASFQSLARFSG
jgi:hypothetical protein